MPYGIKVTEENVQDLIEWGKSVHMNIDHLPYSMEEAADFGDDLYLITDGIYVRNNLTITTMIGPDFFRNWKFAEELPGNCFSRIEKTHS